MYPGEVGSCYEQVTASNENRIQMIDCTDSAATLRSIAVTEGDYLCPTEARYTMSAILPDGTIKTACLESI
jgi:hypothetical protein